MPARRLHQITPTLSAADAVGNQVRLVRALAKERGLESTLFADRTDEASRPQARPTSDLLDALGPDDVVVVHHSFESKLVPLLQRVAQRAHLVLAYHNVTPAEHFDGFDPPVARACRAAREELRALAPICSRAVAFSRFSAQELEAAGFAKISVAPFPVDFEALDAPADPATRDVLLDGCTNVLFVGRCVPNKRVDELLRVFAAYQWAYDRRSRLVLAGPLDRDHPYAEWVLSVREVLGAERVHVLGKVSPAELSAAYQAASVYLSMSAHEGFGVPLVEAMHRGVPVIAYGAAAVPETLGGAGWVCRRDDPLVFARLLETLRRSPTLREQMVAKGRARAADFAAGRAGPLLLDAFLETPNR